MGSLLAYSVCVSIVLIPLYVIYRTVLASTTLLSFNRSMLMCIYAVALLLPLAVALGSSAATAGGVAGVGIGDMTVAIAAIGDEADSASGFDWYRALL